MMKTIKEKSGYAYDEISSVFVDPWIWFFILNIVSNSIYRNDGGNVHRSDF
jgi:hypothetical protein